MARQLEQFSEALTWYALVDTSLRRWKHPPKNKYRYSTDALCGMAMAYRGRGEFSRAIRLLRQTERRYKNQNDLEGGAYALWAMGTTYRFQGQFLKAEKALRQAIGIYRSLKDASGLAYAQAGLGGTLRMIGRPKESGRLYQKANRTFVKLGDKFGLAYTFCGQGNAHRMQNHLSVSKTFMDKAIGLYSKLGQKGPRGFVLWSRAQTNILLGQFSPAANDLHSSGKLFSSVNDRRGLVYVDLGWGEFWRHKNNQRAAQFYRRASQKAKALGLPFEFAHAQRFLKRAKNSDNFYQKLGVQFKTFLRYKSFP